MRAVPGVFAGQRGHQCGGRGVSEGEGLGGVVSAGHGEDIGFSSGNPWEGSEQGWDRIRLVF